MPVYFIDRPAKHRCKGPSPLLIITYLSRAQRSRRPIPPGGILRSQVMVPILWEGGAAECHMFPLLQHHHNPFLVNFIICAACGYFTSYLLNNITTTHFAYSIQRQPGQTLVDSGGSLPPKNRARGWGNHSVAANRGLRGGLPALHT
jgi:hypothetical protein